MEGPTEITPLKPKQPTTNAEDPKPKRANPRTAKNSILQRSYPHRYVARHEPTLEEYNRSTKSDNVNRVLFQMAMRWSLIKSFCSLITVGGVVIIVLTVISTMLCYHYDFEAALPLAFLGTGIFFPISFGISWAFKRREQALIDMADLKSSAVALYQCHREWDYDEARHQAKARRNKRLTKEEREVHKMLRNSKTDSRYAADLLTASGSTYSRSQSFESDLSDISEAEQAHSDEEDEIYIGFNAHGRMALEMRALLIELFEEIKVFLKHDGGPGALTKIYYLFDQIWKQQEELRQRNEWVASLLSRALQYQRFMMLDFEKLKIMHDYRTASTLRGYAFVFLSIFPILFGPAFAALGRDFGLWAGIFTALISSLMFVTLGNIQAFVEDPFEAFGADAINLDMLHEIDRHMF